MSVIVLVILTKSAAGSTGSEQHHEGAHGVGDRSSTQHSGEGRQHHSDGQGPRG